MSCTRGCCATPADHYRSLRIARPDRRTLTKTTTDDHGTHHVDVTEHWHDRQDVLVNLPGAPAAAGSITRTDWESINDR